MSWIFSAGLNARILLDWRQLHWHSGKISNKDLKQLFSGVNRICFYDSYVLLSSCLSRIAHSCLVGNFIPRVDLKSTPAFLRPIRRGRRCMQCIYLLCKVWLLKSQLPRRLAFLWSFPSLPFAVAMQGSEDKQKNLFVAQSKSCCGYSVILCITSWILRVGLVRQTFFRSYAHLEWNNSMLALGFRALFTGITLRTTELGTGTHHL